MLQNIFIQTRQGTLFLISDLYYDIIRDFIIEMSNFVEETGLGEVLLPVQEEPKCIYSHIEIPQIICEHFLTGDKNKKLIPKKKTRYYSAVYRRNEEIPY